MDKTVYLRMAEQDAEHWWFVARRRILRDRIVAMRLPATARILEAGCGPGGNLAMLAEFGRLDAFELDEDARSIAAARSGIQVQAGSLPSDLAYEPGSFDLIAAFDVIEHIDQDQESVRSLAGLLRPGGRLIITVPAYRWLWSAHDERHHHKRRYTRPQICALAEQAGLTIEQSSYFKSLLFPLIAGVRFLKKLLGLTDSPDDAIPAAPINAALTRIFGAERHLLRYLSLPFGVSVLCIARKD